MKEKLVPAGKLVIKKSTLPNAGKGLFTKVFINKGDLIIQYTGKVTTWKDADHDDGRNGYLYYVSKHHVIDGRKNKNSLGRYANDAKGFTRQKGILNNCIYTQDERNKVFIKAYKNIEAGSEILVGYGKEYWDILKQYKKEGLL